MVDASNSAPIGPAPHERWQKIGAGAGALLAGRLVTAACGLIQLPLVFRHLGIEGTGLWLALTGLLWSLGILDCGLGFALQNRITQLVAVGRRDEVAVLTRRALRWLAAGALALLLIAGPVAAWGRWPDWLDVTDPALRHSLPAAVAIMGVTAAINLPLGLAPRLATALHGTWMSGLATALASVAGLAGVAAASRLGFSLPGFMVAGCILPLGANVGTWLLLLLRERWICRADAHAPMPDVSGLWRESGFFFMPQVGAIFSTSLVPMLIGLFAGSAAIAAFGVLQRFYGLALQLHNMVLLPSWPAYAQAAADGDGAFARRMFRTSWLVTAGAFMLPTLLLTPWMPALVRLWLGAQAPVIAPGLLWAVALWHLLHFSGQTVATALNGLGRIRAMAALVWAGIAISLGLCSLLGPRWGAIGVVIALGLPHALIGLPLTVCHANRSLRNISRPATA